MVTDTTASIVFCLVVFAVTKHDFSLVCTIHQAEQYRVV
jgi:hypothetical protein